MLSVLTLVKYSIALIFVILFFLAYIPVSYATSDNEAATPRFAIKQYRLDGNSLLDSMTVLRILGPFTGPQRDFGDIQQAIEALENAYHNSGYSLVTVLLPEQKLNMGEVRLRIIEPRLIGIGIEGNHHFSRENILASLPTLKAGASPLVNAISENLRVANENPAKKIALQFRSEDNPEELHAEIRVKDQKSWRFILSGDNTGTDSTGLYRVGLGFQYYNLFDSDQVMTLQYSTSPDHFSNVSIVSGSYRLPLYRLGDTLDIFGAYSDVNGGTTKISGVDVSVSGKGIVSGFRYNMNLPRSGYYEQKFIGGIDYRLYNNRTVTLSTNLANDVVAHPLSISYGGSWTTEPLVIDGSLGLLYNFAWGSQGGNDDFAAIRSGAIANYLIIRCGLNFLVRPGADWMIRLATNGQYSGDRLIPGEQFGYGGSTVLRGYKEREESWDAGFTGSLELYSPNIAGLYNYSDYQFRLLGFFDFGTGYIERPQSGEPSGRTIKSAGVGFRFGISDAFSLSLDWGYALDDSVQTKNGGNAVHFKGQLAY